MEIKGEGEGEKGIGGESVREIGREGEKNGVGREVCVRREKERPERDDK